MTGSSDVHAKLESGKLARITRLVVAPTKSLPAVHNCGNRRENGANWGKIKPRLLSWRYFSRDEPGYFLI